MSKLPCFDLGFWGLVKLTVCVTAVTLSWVSNKWDVFTYWRPQCCFVVCGFVKRTGPSGTEPDTSFTENISVSMLWTRIWNPDILSNVPVGLEGKFSMSDSYTCYALQCRALTADTFTVCTTFSYTWKWIHVKEACEFKEQLYASIFLCIPFVTKEMIPCKRKDTK